jgi:uncharacterized membrane protein
VAVIAQVQNLYWLRPWRATTRLGVSTVVGLIAWLALHQFWRAPLSGILDWDAGVACYLLLTHRLIAGHSIALMKRRAARLDTRTSVIMAIVVTAACVSLYGLSMNLHGPQGVLPDHPVLRVVLAGVTVLGSWSLIHTVFAVHYTHLYYGPSIGGLIFPGVSDPNYYGFLYYSFVVGMTCQVSDVQVAEPDMRRLTLVHGVLSFFFNTVILALAVSVGAGLL